MSTVGVVLLFARRCPLCSARLLTFDPSAPKVRCPNCGAWICTPGDPVRVGVHQEVLPID